MYVSPSVKETEEMANANLARDDTPVKRELGDYFPREQSQHHEASLLEYHCTMLSRRRPSIVVARWEEITNEMRGIANREEQLDFRDVTKCKQQSSDSKTHRHP